MKNIVRSGSAYRTYSQNGMSGPDPLKMLYSRSATQPPIPQHVVSKSGATCSRLALEERVWKAGPDSSSDEPCVKQINLIGQVNEIFENSPFMKNL
jgi:hypothetical protein